MDNTLRRTLIALAAATLVACQANPHKIEVAAPTSQPVAKTTSLDGAIRDLGLMTQVYEVGVGFMPKPIGDNTGTAAATKFEIPNDVSEMVKSTLNAIGGHVRYVPYDPSFVQNSQITGYGNFENKVTPDVVISGGITEFDRGMEMRSTGTNVDISANAAGGKPLGFKYEDADANAISSITLDFNLLDFQTLTGLPRMQAVNNMKVGKAMAKKEIGFTILGPSFGMNGLVKKIQGRHAAVRVLVQLSMIQLTGRYLTLPYWRVLPGGSEDLVVIDNMETAWYSLDQTSQINEVQRLLYLYDYDVENDGTLGDKTVAAVQQYSSERGLDFQTLSFDLFKHLYLNIPMDRSIMARNAQWNAMMVTVSEPTPKPRRVEEAKQEVPASTQAATMNPEYRVDKEPPVKKVAPGGIRRLKPSEW